MSTNSSIPLAILSWLHAARGPSDATRFLENEFGVALSDAAASGVSDRTLHEWATGSGAAVADEPADHKRFKAFIEKSTAKGLFAGVEEGTPAYDARFEKLVETFARLPSSSSGGGIPRSAGGGGSASASAAAAAPAAGSDANDEVGAEDAKARGNDAVNAQQYHRAVECYSEAISLAPTGRNAHIYYSNRAAAYLSLKEWASAEDDARQSTAISPTWAKGWARLGSALTGSDRAEDAVAAYEKSLELDPTAAAAKQGLAEAREKLRAGGGRRADSAAAVSAPADGAGGGLGGLASMLGGGGGLSGMMSNPALMGMAGDMMSDPEIMASLSDPEVLPIIMQMQSNPMSILQHMGNRACPPRAPPRAAPATSRLTPNSLTRTTRTRTRSQSRANRV
jgi:small glutamine-rich tetratricopeptide repeat-containing protein alpha